MERILLFFALLFIFSCSKRNNTPQEQIETYYNGFRNSDYSQIKSVIADSLTIAEGDYVMPFTPESFYEHFKWDSVFKPIYQSVEIEMKGEHPIATVSVKSLRFEFLKNNPLTCKHRFQFRFGKISKIENLDCPKANWEIWQKERDSLTNWIKTNHPELDGFIHDQDMKGAVNYLKAIELYKKRQVDIIK